MESRLRFTEESKVAFEVDDLFFRHASKYTEAVYIDVVRQIHDNYRMLPVSSLIQNVSCVVKTSDVYYFSLHYVNPDGRVPVFVDIKQIDVDDYLDSIIIKKSFKHG